MLCRYVINFNLMLINIIGDKTASIFYVISGDHTQLSPINNCNWVWSPQISIDHWVWLMNHTQLSSNNQYGNITKYT